MSSVEPFIVSLPLETLARNSGNATSRQRSKGLNINCSELFSPPVLLPGTAPQVQGSRWSPVQCSVSITSTSHGAITREAAGHPFFLAPVPCQVPPASHTHIHTQTGKPSDDQVHLHLEQEGGDKQIYRNMFKNNQPQIYFARVDGYSPGDISTPACRGLSSSVTVNNPKWVPHISRNCVSSLQMSVPKDK